MSLTSIKQNQQVAALKRLQYVEYMFVFLTEI